MFNQKKSSMKKVAFLAAMTMGLFMFACNNAETTSTEAVDSTVVEEPVVEEPVVETVDTVAVDSTATAVVE